MYTENQFTEALKGLYVIRMARHSDVMVGLHLSS